jgi:isoquinoline 1-oxidoreductase beta subunit
MGGKGVNKSRRRFLIAAAGGAAALVVGVYLGTGGEKTRDARQVWGNDPGGWMPNAWLKIDSQGRVTVRVKHSEMGQGCCTGLPAMVAEELEVDWPQVGFEFAPVEAIYKNPAYGIQMTGGSTGTPTSWDPLRMAGAAVREMLIMAAAAEWGVPAGECMAKSGQVAHQKSKRSLPFGQLVAAASKMEPPEEVALKDPKDFKLIGKELPRLDAPAKVEGKAVFGTDVQLPGMLVATVIQPPVFGDRLASFKADKAAKMPGVKRALPISSGLAVVARTYWQASQAAREVEIKWQGKGGQNLDSDALWARWAKMLEQDDAKEMFAQGDANQALQSAAKVISADYKVPFQAHATPEPMNCTAWVKEGRCRIWAPTQNQDAAQEVAARLTGFGYHQIEVHTTFLGGGYGRRSVVDYVAQAVELSLAMKAPVKVVWSREEDIQHDFYRPASLQRLKAGLDDKGRLVAWSQRMVGPDQLSFLLSELFPTIMPYWMPRGVRDAGRWAGENVIADLMEGNGAQAGAAPLPYAIENALVEYVHDDPGVPTGFWRGVGHTANAFTMECFVDEIAHAMGRDPVELRMELFKGNPRMQKVVEIAARESGWKEKPPAGVFRGMAAHEFPGTMVAMVAEISLGKERGFKVERITAAVDCGRVVNPFIVRDQVIGGAAFGLSATIKSSITLQKGRVQQSNFDDFPILRMSEMPPMQVHLVASDLPPKGIGESGVPPLAPAVANAVFAATGKPVRSLPIFL